ncbi:MAG: amino acid adenylation domain-containing protein [Streptosporangiaceae bacterium]
MSFAQRRLWFIAELEGSTATYNLPDVTRLVGELDATALEAAVWDVVGRHEALRMICVEVDGEPYQRVLPLAEAEIVFEHVTVPEPGLLSAVDAALEYEFDLQREIPVRCWLYSAGPTNHAFVLLLHHIAADGWSMGPLHRDLAVAYAARTLGTAPIWTPLRVQYADYIRWQNECLGGNGASSGLAAAQLEFWRGRLAELPEEIHLPADRPRSAGAGSAGRSVGFRTPAAVHGQLVKLAGETGASLIMVLQAALGVLLSRHGGGTDIPFGIPVAGRPDEALEDLVGFFVNTLVLRTDVSGNPSFRTLVERTRAADLEAYSHDEIPFEWIVVELNPVRVPSRHPLFQTMISCDEGDHSQLVLPGLRSERVDVDLPTAKFDLAIHFIATRGENGEPAGIDGLLDYAAARFDPPTVEAFVRRFVKLLSAFAGHPGLPIQDAEFLGEGEAEILVRGWNDTATPVSAATLPELFAGQATRHPDAIALICEDTQVTYAELNARADRLAQTLAARGVRPEQLVAVCLPRTADQVTALLGVLKSGAAYLPVDPDYPSQRIRYMIEDAAPVCALVVAETGDCIPGVVPAIRMDELDLAQSSGTGPDVTQDAAMPCAPHPSHPAYVSYTSGSSGQPKGVVIPHSALSNQVQWLRSFFEARPADRMVPFASVSFDSHVEDVYPALVSGGALVLVRDPAEQLPDLLSGPVGDSITMLGFPFSYWRELVDQGGSVRWPPNLRVVNVGGEKMSRHAVETWRGRLGDGARLINSYGPTETTVNAAAAYITGHLADDPPIGRPLWNTRAFVLDDRMRPVPPGVPGELYLAGRQLARGYLGRPSLTAARFVACPFGSEAGERMYRTGDLVRWNADGELVVLGRTDDQLKVRGFRIEPGDVEAVISSTESVGRCAVVVREDAPGDKRLVAYLVSAEGYAPDLAAVRARTVEALPKYMVPAAFVIVDKLPLTANGKLNRSALPVPAYGSAGEPGRAPQGAREEILGELFAEVLGLPQVFVGDSFFDLGGHSLLVTRLVFRIRQALQTEVRVSDVFENPTVAALARHIAEAGGAARSVLPLRPRQRPSPTPVSFAQRRLWFLDQLQGPSTIYNVPIVCGLSGPLDGDVLDAALSDTIARQEALRTVFADVDGEPYQQVVPHDALATVLGREPVAPGGVEAALRAAASHRFDLSREIPIRAWLFCGAGQSEHTLLILIHHIAADGWSTTLLGQDLARAYAARMADRAPDWDPLPVQYADYALWQRESLGDEADPESLLNRQLAYWRTTLAGLPDELPLPYDRPRSSTSSGRVEHVVIDADAELHLRLAELARAERVTMFMVFHTAAALALQLHGAGQDIPMGTPVAGRGHEALDGLIGFFVNTLVLRTDLGGDPSIRELLARVRATDLAAFDHPEVPFERIVGELDPVRLPARNPLYQTTVNLEGPDVPVRLPGVESRAYTDDPIDGPAAKFDLQFDFVVGNPADAGAGTLAAWVAYDSGLFDRTTAQRLASCLIAVLSAMAAAPSARLSDLPAALPRDVLPPDRAVVAEPNSSAGRRAPANPAEQAIAGIWAQCLGRRGFALGEDFFASGGSIQAAREAVGRCAERFGIEIPLQALIEAPTVEQFARCVHRFVRESTGSRFARHGGPDLPSVRRAARQRADS